MAELDIQKFARVLALISSNHPGEAESALRMANSMLARHGMTWADIAERLKGSGSGGLGPLEEMFRRERARRSQQYEADGCTWESREAYENWRESHRQQREREIAEHAPRRSATLAKYGSERAAIARDQFEQALHNAALPWLEGPNEAPRGRKWLAGRWHATMGGWARYSGENPPPDCVAALLAARPLPTSIRAARDECRMWDERNEDISDALQSWGEDQLDLPAAWRSQRVQSLYAKELPINSLDDLALRIAGAAHDDGVDASEASQGIADAFERLVTAPTGPEFARKLLADPETARFTDREIARRARISPTTAGKLRREVGAAVQDRVIVRRRGGRVQEYVSKMDK